MPKFVSHELTDDLFRRLGGRFIDQFTNKVILVHTVDPNGWAHPAVLSYFEVVARDTRNIRIATYTTSQTTENMRRSGKVTLSIFDEGVTYYVKGTASQLHHEMRAAPASSKLNVAVEQVLVDQADPILEPGAYITNGIMYTNPDLAAARARGLAVLKELLEDQIL
jgi:hypothetical protein